MNYKNILKEQLLSELVRENNSTMSRVNEYYAPSRNPDGTPKRKSKFSNTVNTPYRLVSNPNKEKPYEPIKKRPISPYMLDLMKKGELFKGKKDMRRFNNPSYDYKPNIIH